MRYRNIDSCDLLLQEDARLIQGYLIDYIIYIERSYPRMRASSTINTRIAAVRKFYDCNDIELKWKKIKSYVEKKTTPA